jgi:FO synthase
VSWVKCGLDGCKLVLNEGANDLGGTLMNESISRAAGAEFGQELRPEAMEELIRSAGRTPRQRTTLYADVPEDRRLASFDAPPLSDPLNPPAKDAGLKAPPRLVRPGFAAGGHVLSQVRG